MDYLIANPVAGRGRCANSLDIIRAFYRELNRPFEIKLTEGPGHAQELARQAVADGAERIIAVGGDGTLFEVLNGMHDADVTLGVIPAGTGNDFARSIGFSLKLETALKQLKSAKVKRFDIGRERDCVFSAICGQGFTVDVMHHVNTHRDGFFKGPLAIAAAVYSCVRRLQPQPVTIVVDGSTIETEAILVAVLNTPYTGGGMMLTPAADPADGLLDLIIVGPVGKFEVLRIFPQVYKGLHTSHPKVTIMRGRRFEIYNYKPMLKMFDGNIQGTTPIVAEVVPQAIAVLTPGEA